MLAASRIVVGGIGVMGNLFLVSLRLLNVETGEAEAGLSEKYPSLEALAGDGERLAAALAGGRAGAPAASYRPLTAQSLISSAKAEELSARLARLRRRVRPAEYEDWLKRKGFAGYERDAAVEEKLVFLEEYLDQRNTRGHSLDLGLALFLPGEYTETTTGSDTTHELKGGFGATLGWAYQFSSRFSAGAWASASLGPATITNIVWSIRHRRLRPGHGSGGRYWRQGGCRRAAIGSGIRLGVWRRGTRRPPACRLLLQEFLRGVHRLAGGRRSQLPPPAGGRLFAFPGPPVELAAAAVAVRRRRTGHEKGGRRPPSCFRAS